MTSLLLLLAPLLLFAQGASVQGIVTRSGGSEPLSKAIVDLRPESNDNDILSSMTTDEDIDYVVGVLPGIVERLRELSPYYRKGAVSKK